MTALAPPRSVLSANLICMASMLMWAAALPAAEVLIRPVPPVMPPLSLTAARMVMAAAFLVPIWAMVEGVDALRKARWIPGMMVGSMIGLGALFLVMGQTRTTAVMAAVVASAMPLVGITIEIVLDGRKLNRGIVFGLVLSIAGGILAAGKFDGGLGFGIGALMCLGSVVVFTLASRLTVTSLPGLTPLGSTTVTAVGAAVAASIFAAVGMVGGMPGPDWAAFGWFEFGALALFGIGGFAISQVLWIMAVGQTGIAMSSLHINMTPFYVMVILLALGSTWNWLQAGGAALVAVGVLVAQGIIRVGQR